MFKYLYFVLDYFFCVLDLQVTMKTLMQTTSQQLAITLAVTVVTGVFLCQQVAPQVHTVHRVQNTAWSTCALRVTIVTAQDCGIVHNVHLVSLGHTVEEKVSL